MNLVSLEATPHRCQPTLKNNKPKLHKITKQAFKLPMAFHHHFPCASTVIFYHFS